MTDTPHFTIYQRWRGTLSRVKRTRSLKLASIYASSPAYLVILGL